MGQQRDAIWGGVGRHGARGRKRSQAPTTSEASNCSGDPRGVQTRVSPLAVAGGRDRKQRPMRVNSSDSESRREEFRRSGKATGRMGSIYLMT